MGRPGNPRINETNKATQFKPGQKQPGAGRKPSLLKKFAIENDISKDDISNILKMLLDKTEAELYAMSNDQGVPFFIRGVANAFLADFRRANLYNTETILNRLFGPPKQTIENTGSIEIKIGKEFEGL